jgi:hypothetical protein
MSAEDYHINLNQLGHLFIEKNKALTEAMKNKQKHADLIELFEEVKIIYKQIGYLRDNYVTVE